MCPLPLADGDHAEVGRKHEADTHRVLILVRQRLFGEALRHSLIKAGQHMTVDVATSGSEALSAIGQARPDVVVVGAGFDAGNRGGAGEIVSQLPDCRVIAMVDEREAGPPTGPGGGLHGVVSKANGTSQFVRAIDDCVEGRPLPPVRRASPPSEPLAEGDAWIATLTAREREVLHLLACGATSQDIADRFGVQVNTARKHVQNILTKFQVHSRLEAVTVAIRNGIVDPADVTSTR